MRTRGHSTRAAATGKPTSASKAKTAWIFFFERKRRVKNVAPAYLKVLLNALRDMLTLFWHFTLSLNRRIFYNFKGPSCSILPIKVAYAEYFRPVKQCSSFEFFYWPRIFYPPRTWNRVHSVIRCLCSWGRKSVLWNPKLDWLCSFMWWWMKNCLLQNVDILGHSNIFINNY